jgi:excisionase family DNA binding protein
VKQSDQRKILSGCRKQKQKMSFDEMPELLTIKEVSHILNVHANTLRNWEREGLIHVVRIGPRRDRRYEKHVVKQILHP